MNDSWWGSPVSCSEQYSNDYGDLHYFRWEKSDNHFENCKIVHHLW